MPDHGHSQREIEARIETASGHGVLRDTVYGAIDGAVTTFAIVAGVAGAGLSPFVIVALGLANVLADGFSMAAGNYSGTKAEKDNLLRLRAVEERHIATNPEDFAELEHLHTPVRQIPIGSNITTYTPNHIEIAEARELLGVSEADCLLVYFGFLN